MPGIVRKNLDSPEETRSFKDGKGKLDLVNLDAVPVGRAILQPGWKWSEHVKPLLDPPTDSCQAAHTGYIISGHLRVRMDDGEEVETGPGDFTIIPPGHDAWVVGDEPCRAPPTTPRVNVNTDHHRSSWRSGTAYPGHLHQRPGPG